ncbi:hypothetical protein [Flavobacterium sp.]|uniref:hypothetical protein n=1 Tax=Flavobacterium sp. TaxID=239 RepID=UPI0025CE581B|nr:hypothetical protein [Flavobacterium sp.]
MTPKEKAEELVEKFDELLTYLESKTKTKKCALIAVDEIIRVCPYFDLKIRETDDQLSAFDFQFISYWQEVKQEIEKL